MYAATPGQEWMLTVSKEITTVPYLRHIQSKMLVVTQVPGQVSAATGTRAAGGRAKIDPWNQPTIGYDLL